MVDPVTIAKVAATLLTNEKARKGVGWALASVFSPVNHDDALANYVTDSERSAEMDYHELTRIFRKLKCSSPKEDLTAHIIFTEDSFKKMYSLLSRTYALSSDNKAFWPNMGGYSIFADCLDGTDRGVRLDWVMAEEGIASGWKVQDCYILEWMRDASCIPRSSRVEQSDGTVCYFFGDTCIRTLERKDGNRLRLTPIAGDQTACGQWVDLPVDEVFGYCTLLARHLNQ